MMKVEIIKKQQQKTSIWSGGTTTQLYIDPPDAQYSKMDFLFRVSCAFCRDEVTTFTSLPAVERILMVLDGKVTLNHVDHYVSELQVFEQDTFSGDWKTISYGSCTDFNLMLRNKCSGKVNAMLLYEQQNKNSVIIEQDVCGFYIVEGIVELSCGSYEYRCNQGDFIAFSKEEEKDIELVLKSISSRCTMIQVVVVKP